VVLGNPGDPAWVELQANPFLLTIRDARNTILLQTLEDAGTTPYGTPAVTVDAWEEVTQVIPGWDGYRAHEDPWERATTAVLERTPQGGAVARFDLANGNSWLRVGVEGTRVHLAWGAEQPEGTRPSGRFNKASVAFVLPPDEHFLGLGERYATSDHRGWSLYSYAEEAGVGAGEDAPPSATNPGPNGVSMTYFPVPFFLSTRGYGLHANTTFRTELHLGSERPDAWRLAANTASFETVVYVNANPLDTLDQFTADTGRPLIPAPWVFGNRRRIGRGAVVEGVPEWQRMRDLGMPITGIDDALHFLPHRSELGIEAQLATWTSTLHANGFKIMGYYNPYVSATRPTAAADYAHGRDNGLFLRGPDGQPSLTFFISGVGQEIAAIDLTNPAGEAWFHTLLQRSVDLGYDGWMHDFGEYTARDVTAFDGRTGEELHNAYPVLSARAAHRFWEATRPGDYLFFVRSGYTGSQAFIPAVWSGDPEGSFDQVQGLPSMLRGGVNLGLSGVPYFGPDAQGYKCINEGVDRNQELYFRWLQFSAVTPIMMDQDRCFALTMERPKWFIWDDAFTSAEYGRYASLHTRLQPYFLLLAAEAHARGTPIMRHPFLVNPEQPAAALVDGAYWLGPSLFTAPVVARGQTVKDTWLPPGRFVDFWDHRVFVGGTTVAIPAPITVLPLLVKENALVPLLDAQVQTLAPATVPNVVTAQSVADRLDVLAAISPGGSASLTLVDRTVLQVTHHPGRAGNPLALATVDPAAVQDCARCTVAPTPSGDVTRVRLNSALATEDVVDLEELSVSFGSGPARRVRWDVLVLP